MNMTGIKKDAYRCGAVLIIAAGISALMASLALAFLLRMRSDVMESTFTVRDAQARIMLMAACHYIQEASRIGYDDANNEFHKEAYGWIDVRDGAIGPKPSNATHSGNGQRPYGDAGYGVDDARYFPTQSVRICSMDVAKRPPFAISMNAAPNPIDPDPPSNGTPYLVNADPQLPPQISLLPTSQQFAAWESGDPTPRQHAHGVAWFRLLRCGPGKNAEIARYNAATFIVTCGAGGSRGYRSIDWLTMLPEERGLFGNDKTLLTTLEADEVRYWYLVEWSPAVGDVVSEAYKFERIMVNPMHQGGGQFPQYTTKTPNYTFGSGKIGSQPIKQRNLCGTISYVQRLVNEPPEW